MNRIIIAWCVLNALFCGCGPERYTWVYGERDVLNSPRTQQKYSIRSFRINCCDKERKKDAVRAAAAKTGGAFNRMRHTVSHDWVDKLYDKYPEVFDETGVPVDLVAEYTFCVSDSLPEFDRSAFRFFCGSLGMFTIGIVPFEGDPIMSAWKLGVSQDGSEQTDLRLHEVSEKIFSLSPLGFFCFYCENGKGDFQIAKWDGTTADTDIFNKQMEALGAGLAWRLAQMEKDGRIKVGGKAASAVIEPQLAGKQDERTRILAEERRKNLDSLLKSGVITEEEYKKEIGKGTK